MSISVAKHPLGFASATTLLAKTGATPSQPTKANNIYTFLNSKPASVAHGKIPWALHHTSNRLIMVFIFNNTWRTFQMKKTTVLLSAATVALCASSTGFGLSDLNFGPQMGASTIQNSSEAIGHVINAYGLVGSANLSDRFSADLNYTNAGTYMTGIADLYYVRHLTNQLTSRFGLGAGVYHQNSVASDASSESKFAYQGAIETEYRINESIGFNTSYHYLLYKDIPSKTHVDQFMIGVNYYLN